MYPIEEWRCWRDKDVLREAGLLTGSSQSIHQGRSDSILLDRFATDDISFGKVSLTKKIKERCCIFMLIKACLYDLEYGGIGGGVYSNIVQYNV
jgi:hypothetical protein